MRVTRIHVASRLAPGVLLELPEGQARHLTRVLRLEPGAPLVLFNGEGGEHEAVIESVHRQGVGVRIGAFHPIERESPLHITLLQGIARGEKMDLILQKATELGVSRIVPLSSLRSTVRLTPETATRKQQHWQAVVASACEQCGRNRVPEVAAPSDVMQAIAGVDAAVRLLLVPEPQALNLGTVLARAGAQAAPPAVALLIGPEGGLDAREIRAALAAGFTGCRMGPRILRTETAALVALSMLQAAAGDLDRDAQDR